MPIDWEDETFLPYDWGQFAFVYDTQALPNPPASFQELLDAPDDLKVIISDPRTSVPGLGLLLLPPLVAVVVAGAAGLPDIVTQQRLWPASLRSLVMALCAGLGAVMLALALLGGSGQLILVLPARVMGTGLFLLLRPNLGAGQPRPGRYSRTGG